MLRHYVTLNKRNELEVEDILNNPGIGFTAAPGLMGDRDRICDNRGEEIRKYKFYLDGFKITPLQALLHDALSISIMKERKDKVGFRVDCLGDMGGFHGNECYYPMGKLTVERGRQGNGESVEV